MTRSMVASVLYRMEGTPECTEGPTFTDVPEGSWFAPGVQWAAQMGITSGTGGGRFAPEEPVTREALAAMLYRYAQQHGAGAMGTGSGTENFADRESISSWAGEAMEWAASKWHPAGKWRRDPSRRLGQPRGSGGHADALQRCDRGCPEIT